ncbi:MAG: helix-turn-helix domain-containing protein [Thermodesulfobacteriota bacterium]
MKRNLFLYKIQKRTEWFRHVQGFIQKTGVPLRLLNPIGRISWESEFFKRQPNFCHLIQSTRFSRRLCAEAHKEALRESLRWGEAIFSKCCFFIMQIVAPILKNGKVVGGLVASPFLLVNPSELQPEELDSLYQGRLKKTHLFEKALLSIPVVKDREVKEIAQYLFQLADNLSDPDLGDLIKIREAQVLQGKIADQIRRLKDLDRELTADSLSKLFYEREKEIVTKIRLGDREGAKEILYQLLAIILVQYLENFELLKISILELLIILSRAAVEAGAKIEEILGLRYGFITEIAKLRDQEELCVWIVKILEKMTEQIYQTRNAKNYQRLKKVMEFIEAHYNEPLTVEQIAREIYLSPSRLSHIIKDEFGTTLMDCISKVRIDKAKRLLDNGEISIAQIAQEVGFSDQSYFTKVFKKIEGCTPKIYRVRLSQTAISERNLSLSMV